MKWHRVPLGNMTRMVGGGTPSKSNDAFWTGGAIPWVSPKDMGVREIYAAADHITKAAVEGSSTQIVPPGSVLIVVRSGILVRRFPIAIARVPVAINQDMKAFLPSVPIAPEFLAYALEARSDYVLSACVKRGATVHSIDISKLDQMLIPLPPLSEQRRIAEILNQADELTRKRAEADAKTQRILPALFYKLFGDPATNPRKWTTCRLGDLLAETMYGTSAPSNSDGRGTVVVRMGNIGSDGWIDLGNVKHIEISESDLAKLRLRRGDILFNRTNSRELVGKTGLWSDTTVEAVPASYLIRLRTRTEVALPEFVWASMNTPFFKRLILDMARRAIGMANINATEVRSMPAFLPPLNEQRKFAIALSRTEKLRRARLELGTRLELLATVLSARAFSGTLTAKWREGHLKELLSEMAEQARALGQGSEETKEPASP